MPGPTLPKGKIAGVKSKYLVFAAMAVVAFLVWRHFKGQQSTSAGSTSVPQPASASLPSPTDSTGGGASGLGANDLANALGALSQFQAQPLTPTVSNYYYYPSSGANDATPQGGNTSTSTTASGNTATTPPTSFPYPSSTYQAIQATVNQSDPFNTINYGASEPPKIGTIAAAAAAFGAAGAPGAPKPPVSANYGGGKPLTKEQVTARNKRQAA